MKFEKLERTDKQIPLILKLDLAGQPVEWFSWREAVTAQCNDKVKWGLGTPIDLTCGTNGFGERKIFQLNPIVACEDQSHRRKSRAPVLTNRTLFRRDGHLCLYCGQEYSSSKLTRDHVIPTSKGGKNIWANVVTACRGCNHYKADRTPEQAQMPLLAVPYTPNIAEHLILQNRRIIADQMDYLKQMVPKDSRLWKNLNT